MSKHFFIALKWIILVFFLFAFAYKTATFIDPDLGWHLRAGEIVTNTGHVPLADPWTYTAYGHEWIDHEWFVDAILWNAHVGNFWSDIVFLFTLIVFIPIAVWLRRAQNSVELIFAVAAAHVLYGYIGVRPQMLSFLFFFVCYELLHGSRFAQKYSKIIYASAPLFFWLWANLHGGFVGGLVFWGILLFAKYIEAFRIDKNIFKKSELSHETLFFIISTLATLATPYHLNLWKEIIVSTTNPIIYYIGEWQPAFASSGLILPFFIGGMIALLLFFYKNFTLKEFLPLGFFFVTFMMHTRMGPFFFIVALPLVFRMIRYLEKPMSETLEKFSPTYQKMFAISPLVIVFVLLVFTSTEDILTDIHRPPIQAVQSLAMIEPKISDCNIYNEYGYGGTMIFFNPNRKVFIDGRLPHWETEGDESPFRKTINLSKNPDSYAKLFSTYDICAVFTHRENLYRLVRPQLKNMLENPISLWEKIIASIARLLPEQKDGLMKKLTADGWCTVYSDEQASILLRPDGPLCRNHKTRP